MKMKNYKKECENFMEKEQFYLVEDGWGFQRRIREEKVPVAIEEYRMLKRVAKEVGCTQDIVDKYELKITKEED